MPVSDPPEHPSRPNSAAPIAALPAALEAVVQRWNPQGMALLRAVAGFGNASGVMLIGPDDANTTLLRTELARFEPHVDLTDPVADARTAVETTSPSGDAPAAVALILLDAGTTLGAGVLDMVRGLRAGGTRVLLAMNGIHAHQDWRAVRERDLALLAGEGITDIDIVPVSARLAVAARSSGDTALLDRSGLAALHAELTAATLGAAGEGDDRLLAVRNRVLTDTRARIVEQVAALRSGTEAIRLREERATLLAGRDGGRAAAMSNLRSQLNLARLDLMTEVGARTRALHTAARAELDRLGRSDIGDYPDRLQQAVTELAAGVDVDIEHRLAELAARVGGPDPGPVRRDPPPRVGPDPEPRQRGVEDHLMIALGASAGVGLGRLLVAPFSLVPALDVASVPVTLLLGAGVAAWVVRARAQLADRNHLRQWVADALVNVKAQLEQRVGTAMVEAEGQLSERVMRASNDRMVEVDRKAAELEARLRRYIAEQPGQLAACERDIESIDHWMSSAGRGTNDRQ
ncbi:hypothetical protein [Nocardia cyriacigeorgica]|uniref:Uncharacterized protein n=2 Tax=Nocardia cyriacigeorgica TaxID=135487 RepID=H6R8E5_NOCCG|nr:hypothetical protein [Nocardia cyriacigeorgica]BDT89798.1 hypothetical protein FMUAM8_55620 [Nocardia cyriacigeorgica]BDU09185.1 hypothetical protein FMUBM48_54480 [Nocardia cyriacigeorgica]CCF66092.1 conserved protein of unknown function [Nocardia cyriacigeorgica GUH-2]